MTFQALGSRLALAMLLCASALSAAPAEELKEAGRLYQRGQIAEALQKIDSVLAATPKDVQAQFLKGVILTAQNNHAEAMRIFTALTEDYPELPEPHNNLAVLYASQGQYENARAELELAIRTNPGYATAHENLADVYVHLAAREYEQASTLDRNNTTAAPKLKLIKQLSSKNTKTPASAELESKPPLKP
jgi:tetratricopeptide (TPR) repeat protein